MKEIKGIIHNCSFYLSNTIHWHAEGFCEGGCFDGINFHTSRVLSFIHDADTDKYYIETKNSIYEIDIDTLNIDDEDLLTVLETFPSEEKDTPDYFKEELTNLILSMLLHNVESSEYLN